MTREETPTSGHYAFGPFRIDTAARQLYRGDECLGLAGRAFDTLLILVSRHGQVVEKDDLLALVWPDTHVSEDSLTQSISVVRRVLGDDPGQPQLIATVPRRGYRFIARVTAGPPPAPAGAVVASPDLPPTAVAGRARRWRPLLWLGLPAAVVLFVFARSIDVPRAVPTIRPVRFAHEAPAGTTLTSGGVLSPDGRHLAFVTRQAEDGKTRVWVRAMDAAQSRALPGTEGAFRPFWSPDGEFVGFFADGRLKKAGLGGAPPQTLANVGYHPSGGTWSQSGVILYSDRMSRLYAVRDTGDAPVTPATTLDQARNEVAHYSPQFLPDGRHFLFYVDSRTPGNAGTFIGSLDSLDRTRLFDPSIEHVTFAPPGHVVYLRDQVLMAQPFDPARFRLSGTPAPIGANMVSRSETISASASGLLAFGGDATAQHLVWFDRSGQQRGALAASSEFHNPALSPDERQLLGDRAGIWLIDLDRGAPTRIAEGALPAWSPDGQGIVYTARKVPGSVDLYLRTIAGKDDERVLVRSQEMKLSGHWSRDGRHFVYVGSDPESRLDIWALALGPSTSLEAGAPHPFLRTTANEMQPSLSPDGRWIAYASDEAGSWEVYVQSFPMAGAKRAISVGGGAEPQWTKDGRELIYLTPDGQIMAVDIAAGVKAIEAGRPKLLFRAAISGDITTFRNHYVVTADGQRFLVDVADERTREPINVVVNWDALVGR